MPELRDRHRPTQDRHRSHLAAKTVGPSLVSWLRRQRMHASLPAPRLALMCRSTRRRTALRYDPPSSVGCAASLLGAVPDQDSSKCLLTNRSTEFLIPGLLELREQFAMTEMRSYRAYYLSESDHIRDVSAFKATDDMGACLEADFRLAQSEYAAIEVYEGWRLVWRKERQQQAA